jgi:hypothetical protein
VAGNTGTTVQANQTFSTSVVPIAVGVLNPTNSPQTVWAVGVGMTYAAMTTIVAGGPGSFSIVLEGTYDGNTWTTLVTTTNTSGETQYTNGLIPFTSLRARCTAVAGGSNPTVNVFVTTSQTPFTRTTGGTNPGTYVSVLGSVDSTQVLNGYGSIAAYGKASAPTAGTAVATLAVFNFYYKVDVVVGFGTTAESTAIDNYQLQVNGTALVTLPVANAANTQSQTYTFYISPGGSVNITVNAISNASIGSNYKALIAATRLI